MDKKKIMDAIRMLLEGIGEDPNREGLLKTPERVARMYEEILFGIGVKPENLLTVLEEEHDEIILVKDVPFYSICEHHLLPFKGICNVAYLPDRRITGLSKIVRLIEACAARPQVQERMTTQIANALMRKLKPKGVMVVVEAEHLCMTMRGVRKPGSKMVTSVVRGIFRENEKTRLEALSLIGNLSSRIEY
ncbi:MAG: GTP cyclohydrolase I FolE [Planctomycetota bacterium]|nr:GTP cyclohydrolase I FolE [Planctomycetota bacterium]